MTQTELEEYALRLQGQVNALRFALGMLLRELPADRRKALADGLRSHAKMGEMPSMTPMRPGAEIPLIAMGEMFTALAHETEANLRPPGSQSA